jgi:recombination endonuclease VII
LYTPISIQGEIMKICTKCGEPGTFHKDIQRKDGLHPQCTICVSEQRKAWRIANPDKVKEQAKRDRLKEKKNPDALRRSSLSCRKHRLKKKYKLTPESWDFKFQVQGQCCDICKTKEPGKKGWSTDHDHSTEKTRSILCAFCNPALGLFKDSPELLRKAADYIEFWKEIHNKEKE